MFENEREERGEVGKRVGIAIVVLFVGFVVWGLTTGIIPLNYYLGEAAELVPDPFEEGPPTRLRTKEFVPIEGEMHSVYAGAFIGAVKTGVPTTIAAHFSWRQSIAHGLDGLDFDTEVLEELVRSTTKVAVEQGLPRALADLMKGGGTVTWVGTREADGHTWTVLRVRDAAGVTDHLELLVADSDSGIRAWDFRLNSTGERFQELVRMAGLGLSHQAAAGKLKGRDALLMQGAGALNAVQGGRPLTEESVLASLDELPDEVFEEWPLLEAARVGMAVEEGPDAVLRASARYVERFGDDPWVAWLRHTVLREAGRHDEALAALDELTRLAAPDPYFGVMRASTLAEAGRADEAKAAVEAAVQAEPELAELPEVKALR